VEDIDLETIHKKIGSDVEISKRERIVSIKT